MAATTDSPLSTVPPEDKRLPEPSSAPTGGAPATLLSAADPLAHPYAVDSGAALAAMSADADHGLAAAEAQRRLAIHGPNALAKAVPPSLLGLVARQFQSPLVALLLVGAVVS